MEIVSDPQQGGDTSIAKQPDTASEGDIPQMDMEKVYPRQVSTGLGRGIQQLGSPNIFVDSGDNQIIVAKDTVNQVLMGDQSTFGEGFYVTKAGIDAKTAKSPDDFIFNSNQNIFKIISSGTINIDIPNPFTTGVSPLIGTVRHDLNTRPGFMVYGDIPSGAGAYSGTGNLTNLPVIVGGSGSITVMAQAFVTTTTITVQIINMFGASIADLGTPWVFKYYLLQETAN